MSSVKKVQDAVRLIDIQGDDSFRVNPEALDILNSIPPDACVSIVAVAGLYRTGKSSLMNWLLDRQAGFTVGPTVNRCTRGLWIWGAPIETVAENGQRCFVVLLDSEGLGSLETNADYDARVFALAVLLCSTLVYNSLGSIDENAIANLSFIAQLSKHIRISGDEDSKEKDDAMEFHRFFPSFVWVVRDFTLSLEDEDGEEISALDYLERSLENQTGFEKATLERNRIREMLRAFFSERNCVTLVRPLSDEGALQQVDLVPYEELREEFRSGLSVLKNTIFSRPKPKNINGKALTGPMFAALCQAYVDAINSGGVPTISSAWEDVTAKENANAAEAALAEYRRVFGEQVPSLPVESAAINAGDKVASEVALNMYARRAVGESAKQGRKELSEKIEAIFAERCEANMRESQAQCAQLVQQLYAQKVDPLAASLDAEETSYQQAVSSIRSAWTEAVQQYEEQAVGPAKYSELASFCNRQLLNLLQVVTASMQQNFDTRMNEVRTEMLRAQQEAAQLKANAEVLENSLAAKDAKLESLTSKVSAMAAETTNLEQRVAELTKQKREAERRAEEQEDNATQMRGKLEDRDLEIKRLEEARAKHVAEIDSLNAALRQKDDEIAAAAASGQGGCACVVM